MPPIYRSGKHATSFFLYCPEPIVLVSRTQPTRKLELLKEAAN